MSGVSFAVGVVAIDPVPAGGTIGQALVKKSDGDYDTQWASVVDPATLGTMSTQNANSVAITGGTITNLTTFDGITIDGGTY